MRKKSHLTIGSHIGKRILNNKHKISFCFGNLLPDLVPSFITTRHEIEKTFLKVEKAIKELLKKKENGILFNIKLGSIIHYISDYFTLPHNKFFKGSFKDHCVYEGILKHKLREYVKAKKDKAMTFLEIKTPETLLKYIKARHKKYKECVRSIKTDCEFIFTTACQVAYSLIKLYKRAYEKVIIPVCA